MTRWPRFIFEEIRFIRSINSLRNFYHKLPYLMPRMTGSIYRDTRVPLSLQIEPTNHCNARCICCSRERMERPQGYMDFALFTDLIDQAAAYGVRRIHLYLHGEPMLHPQIVQMIRYTKQRGIGIQLATNGMLFSEDTIRAILHAGVNNADHIIFSVLGHSKEVHESIMRRVSHERVLNNIKCFLTLRGQYKVNGPLIETIMYVMDQNRHEKQTFQAYWRGVADHVRDVGEISQQFAVYKKGQVEFPIRQKTCKNLWERMTIYWNGDVTICCADLDNEYCAGSVRDNSIVDVWNAERLRRIKALHRQKKFAEIPLCATCDW